MPKLSLSVIEKIKTLNKKNTITISGVEQEAYNIDVLKLLVDTANNNPDFQHIALFNLSSNDASLIGSCLNKMNYLSTLQLNTLDSSGMRSFIKASPTLLKRITKLGLQSLTDNAVKALIDYFNVSQTVLRQLHLVNPSSPALHYIVKNLPLSIESIGLCQGFTDAMLESLLAEIQILFPRKVKILSPINSISAEWMQKFENEYLRGLITSPNISANTFETSPPSFLFEPENFDLDSFESSTPDGFLSENSTMQQTHLEASSPDENLDLTFDSNADPMEVTGQYKLPSIGKSIWSSGLSPASNSPMELQRDLHSERQFHRC